MKLQNSSGTSHSDICKLLLLENTCYIKLRHTSSLSAIPYITLDIELYCHSFRFMFQCIDISAKHRTSVQWNCTKNLKNNNYKALVHYLKHLALRCLGVHAPTYGVLEFDQHVHYYFGGVGNENNLYTSSKSMVITFIMTLLQHQ